MVDALIEMSYKSGAEGCCGSGSVSPSGAYNTMAAFEVCGIAEVARKRGVELIDLNSFNSLYVEILRGMVIKRVKTGTSIVMY